MRTETLANISIALGVILFLANPFVPYWFLGISGSILIAGGIVARAILHRRA